MNGVKRHSLVRLQICNISALEDEDKRTPLLGASHSLETKRESQSEDEDKVRMGLSHNRLRPARPATPCHRSTALSGTSHPSSSHSLFYESFILPLSAPLPRLSSKPLTCPRSSTGLLFHSPLHLSMKMYTDAPSQGRLDIGAFRHLRILSSLITRLYGPA